MRKVMLRSFLKSLMYYKISYLDKQRFENFEIYVTSHGGVGTSFIGEYLSKLKSVNEPYNDKDLVKHLPLPPKRAPSNLKTLYIFGDPVMAVVSLFRRGYAQLQSCKNGSFRPINADCSLEMYIRSQEDRLNLIGHFEAWTNPNTVRCDTLVINYESLWDEKDKIASFLAIPVATFSDFPQRGQRESEQTEISQSLLLELRAMYSAYYRRMEEIGSAKLLRPL